MPSITKPLVPALQLERNAIGLTIRDYEGPMSTLCAGCGHDSTTAALVQALWQAAVVPHRVAKLSGIGCSSKTPTYFLRGAHGFNSVHGRMVPIATGANAANRDLLYLGISGDGDALSIGLGHLCHGIRRNVHMVHLIENNGVYGLTKGQFSPTADQGSTSHRGEHNALAPIDPMLLGLSLGATFLARGFSGDKAHLVPILEAAIAHGGFALVDVISPCVQFNNHEGSTKSYAAIRASELHVTDFAPPQEPVTAMLSPEPVEVAMPGGGAIRFRSVPMGYDPTDRTSVAAYLADHAARGEVPTGLLYVDESVPDVHERNRTTPVPLNALAHDELCPGADALRELQAAYR
ncbi:MAG: 2-oxoacid:ferredoxin oxidoreductase subunit beta [Actinomycetota bacterium]|nr:2-oxoacid:ferredoxin oxidoreductase subunit beta [Actinomycetota bacterium]